MPRRKAEPELDPMTGEILPPEPKEDKAPRQTATRLVPRKAIESGVGLLNGIIGMLSPADALTMSDHAASNTLTINLDDEFGMLVDALDAQQKEHRRFRQYLSRFVMFSGGANLLGVVGLILYRRYMLRVAPPAPPEGQPQPESTVVPYTRPDHLGPFEPDVPAWTKSE